MPFLYFGLTVLAWMIVWHFLLRSFAARHANSPWAQGISNLS